MKFPVSLLAVILLGSLVHRKSALAAGFPAPSFAAGRTFDVGMGVLAMVVGDFNGDGKPDLAVGQWVVLGNGDGTFQAAVNYGAGVGPWPVAVGNFNGDGKADLAVLNSSGVSVLLNTCASAGIRLGVARTNTGLTFSWPLPHAGFILESITSVGSTNWQRPIEALTTNNGRLEVTAPFDQPGRFFRLRKP